MHRIISDISNPVNLQQLTDNRDGVQRVGLKSFTYCWGWHNIHNEVFQKQGESGYYSFEQLADLFLDHKFSMFVDGTNGRVSLSTLSELKISKRLQSVLGLHVKGRFSLNHTHRGDEPLDYVVIKPLYIHLSDVKEFYNFHNGSPSDVLAVIPIENKSFGDIVTVRF